MQPDGRIVITGRLYSRAGVVLLRLLPDGSLDPTFGGDAAAGPAAPAGAGPGWVTYDFGGNSWLGGLEITGDGHLLAAGTADRNVILTRFNADGSPDAGFGTGGKVVTNLVTESPNPSDMAHPARRQDPARPIPLPARRRRRPLQPRRIARRHVRRGRPGDPPVRRGGRHPNAQRRDPRLRRGRGRSPDPSRHPRPDVWRRGSPGRGSEQASECFRTAGSTWSAKGQSRSSTTLPTARPTSASPQAAD